MSNGDFFYVCGGALAVSAVLVSFAGLRIKGFPGKAAPIVALGFIALIGATTTFAVLHAQDEEEAKAAEFSSANEEITKEEASPTEGETLKLSASPTELAFDTTSLTSKPGKVTIDFNNPAALEHNVAIEQDGKEIATSETLAEGETSVSADLTPGTYTYLCTIPGHAEAGMEGTLTVR